MHGGRESNIYKETNYAAIKNNHNCCDRFTFTKNVALKYKLKWVRCSNIK